MAKTIRKSSIVQPIVGPIDCACLIHGDVYDWTYVERLYNMLDRHLSQGVRLHVYTEANRIVPAPMIKHELQDWGISGPKKAWWYKLQLFDSKLFSGALLYFDLDVVIVDNIDWITCLPLNYFWGVKDFKYLWRPNHSEINSSVMWWDTQIYDFVWQEMSNQNLNDVMKKYRGDQNYISEAISNANYRFLDPVRIQSWRWQCYNGGYNFAKKTYKNIDSGTVLSPNTNVLVFHGKPKPGDLQDPVIVRHWK
jgi:hypothetical protein